MVDGAVLRPTVGMMDQSLRGGTCCQSTTQGFDSKIALQAVTCGPVNDAPREEVRHDSEAKPSLCRPGVEDARPHFLSGPSAARSCATRSGAARIRKQSGGSFPRAAARPVRCPSCACSAALGARSTGSRASDKPCDAVRSRGLHPQDLRLHARAATGAVRQRRGGPVLRRIDHVLSLAQAGRTVLPSEDRLGGHREFGTSG